MASQPSQPAVDRHIELRTSRGGDAKPFITGTRVSVQNVYVWHELQGMSPDEIVAAYPHLSLSQVHAALAYYYDHADEIRDQLTRDEALADALAGEQGPTRLTSLKRQLQRDKGADVDPLSSG
jgi:uncharacterized protein (DUF433 family)